MNIEKISAVTRRVASMTNSVRFYRDVLGMQIIYGGEEDCFSSLAQEYMKIECPQCWVAYHLYHDGLQMKLLRGYCLRANWEISGEHPKHNSGIVFETSSAVAQEKASQTTAH